MAASKLIRWPTWLKPSVVDSYDLDNVDRRETTEMDSGVVTRQVFTPNEGVATYAVFLNSFQAYWFEGFEANALRHGSRHFEIPIWNAGKLQYQEAYFKTRPKIVKKDGEYTTYVFTLEINNLKGAMPGGAAEAFTYIDPKDFAQIADLLQYIVNVDIPKGLAYNGGTL